LKGPVQPGAEIARTSDTVASLSLQTDNVISCLFMDEERYLRRAGPLLRNIRREGVTVMHAVAVMAFRSTIIAS